MGRLGILYARDLANRIPSARLVAVADTDKDRAQKVGSEFGVRSYTRASALVEDKDLDAVVIATPTNTHQGIVQAALEGRKPIFCEKPLSLSLRESVEIQQAVEKSSVFFQMGFVRRFDKGFREAKKKIEEGVIGRPVVFKAMSRDPYLPSIEYVHPRNSGGLLIDMGVHDFDLARWLVGEVRSVHAVGGTLVYPELKSIGDIDNAIATLTFAKGALGVVDLSRNGLYGYDISADLLGTEGTLRVGYLQQTPLLVMKKNNVSHDVVPFFPERFGDAYLSQLEDFAGNLLHDRPPPITIDDGIEALRISIAATRSCQTGKTVEVASITHKSD